MFTFFFFFLFCLLTLVFFFFFQGTMPILRSLWRSRFVETVTGLFNHFFVLFCLTGILLRVEAAAQRACQNDERAGEEMRASRWKGLRVNRSLLL